MKNKITVILKKNLANLGSIGTVVKVSSGYAFNYLIPRDFAQLATQGSLKHHKMFLDMKQQKLDEIQDKLQASAQKFNKISKISVKKKVGNNNQIFGSVNDKEIISKLFSITGEKLEKKNIYLPNIKALGIYNLNIIFTSDIQVSMKLQILPFFA
uniref:Large ribosomal subunit protein bL9c n=1 Tax=Gracilaria tenuistipitata var. liui TaxID=285951 RepID=RK9_GRATL|nr:ribosomal protein L9 [Gracilaria tenuistipitata var. liui]Q6B909.1 RecName: Full=Large ribosomal subunit protein bL9c; AltName: Full=50S ribosomal protein L9, chloroplastic [Gracilaria tenuistipitata var. liui]AAT79626.1 50S ribosomal protein L9 [Gracilaria tenuistipitata var. liui]